MTNTKMDEFYAALLDDPDLLVDVVEQMVEDLEGPTPKLTPQEQVAAFLAKHCIADPKALIEVAEIRYRLELMTGEKSPHVLFPLITSTEGFEHVGRRTIDTVGHLTGIRFRNRHEQV